jgi:hypothetical protein
MLRRTVWYIGADILEKLPQGQSASQEGLPAFDYVNCSWPKSIKNCNLVVIGVQSAVWCHLNIPSADPKRIPSGTIALRASQTRMLSGISYK